MARSGKYRGLASIAILRLSENDLIALHNAVSDMSASSFLELVRDIEDEIDNSIHLSLKNLEETSFSKTRNQGLFLEIDNIRRKELQVTVTKFAEILAKLLNESQAHTNEPIPIFDSRRGLQAWINKLVSTFGEQQLFQYVSRIKKRHKNTPDSDWKLQ